MVGEYDAGYENCIYSMVRQMEDMQFRIDNLHRENAKLHELVLDMVEWAYIDSSCDLQEQFADRMRELGVDE